MGIIKVRLATTHLDKHNDRLLKSALIGIIEQIKNNSIPYWINHDPRIPPQGRFIKADLILLDDGEYAVDCIVETFDKNKYHLNDNDNKQMPLRKYNKGELKIIMDNTFKDEKSKQYINDLKEILKKSSIEKDVKKSLDAISILKIGGEFALGAIMAGFLKEIGVDAYKSLKSKLIEIYNKSQKNQQEKLFIFDTTISNDNQCINVEIIITNPTVEDIQQFFDEGIKQLDQILPRHFEENKGFSQIVFEYKAKCLEIKFAVLKNEFPINLN